MQEKFFNRLAAVAVVIFIFAVMFALNNLMPLHRDDYDYSMIWKTGEHITSLPDVFESTWRHYFLHGGRLFTVFCLNLFLWLGKFPFDVANAALFAVLVLLIYFHARREFKIGNEFGILAATGLLAWLSFPHFGEVAVWKSGSTVYLWSAVPAAIFLLPYNFFLAKKFSAGKFFAVGMFFLGILSGCSVENLGVTSTFLTIFISFHCAKKNIFQNWMASGAVGSFIGLIILLIAPGNFVRYEDQSVGKGIFAHIGNQFAGNAEMFLYLLPAVLILICACGILKKNNFSPQPVRLPIVPVIIATIFIISYFNDSFITSSLKNFFVNNIFPHFNTSTKFLERFDNFMMKSEEMIIYLLIIFSIYLPLKKSLGLKNFPTFNLPTFPTCMFALGLINNFVMIAAPTFPARATFSSVVMILIGTISVLRLPVVREKFSAGLPGKILKIGAAAIGSFTIISALVITAELNQENNWRIAEVQKASENHQQIVKFPPIDLQNRALRHVFFVDFDNGVTKDGLCEFYKIKNIEIINENN